MLLSVPLAAISPAYSAALPLASDPAGDGPRGRPTSESSGERH
jgi:hypothetical protein